MTISSTILKNQYEGNGLATTFPYEFKVIDEDQVRVIHTDADDVATVLVESTDFTVSGVGNEGGGDIVYPVSGDPLPAGEYLTIKRKLDLTQLTDLHNQGGFYLETIEDAFDYAMMISQMLQEEIDRCPKLAEDSRDSAFELLDEMTDVLVAVQALVIEAKEYRDDAVEAGDTAQSLLDSIQIHVHEETAIASQTQITVIGFNLAPELENIGVYIDGVKQRTSSLSRIDDDIVQIGYALSGGELIEVRSSDFLSDGRSNDHIFIDDNTTVMQSNVVHFVNCSVEARTVTLPLSPEAGEKVEVQDYTDSSDSNNITVLPNGNKIKGEDDSLIISVRGSVTVFTYSDATNGWTITVG